MQDYCVNTNVQPNGDHEVHHYGCAWLPEQANRLYLGKFFTCTEAVAEARKHYRQSNGCYYCSPICHTQ